MYSTLNINIILTYSTYIGLDHVVVVVVVVLVVVERLSLVAPPLQLWFLLFVVDVQNLVVSCTNYYNDYYKLILGYS